MTYIRKKSKAQESRTAKEFKGKTTIASGALYFQKADVRTGAQRTSNFNETDFLIENKFTDKNYYKLDRRVWDKISLEAINDNFRIPIMQVDIQDLQLILMGLNDFDVYNKYGYEYFNYETVTTLNNSIRLIKDELESQINNNTVLFLTFRKPTPMTLIVMTKDIFFDIGRE